MIINVRGKLYDITPEIEAQINLDIVNRFAAFCQQVGDAGFTLGEQVTREIGREVIIQSVVDMMQGVDSDIKRAVEE